MKTAQLTLILIGLAGACWSARVAAIVAAHGHAGVALPPERPAAALVPLFTLPAALSLLVAPFLVLEWYYAIGIVAYALLFFGMAVRAKNLRFFVAHKVLFDVATIVCAIGFWWLTWRGGF